METWHHKMANLDAVYGKTYVDMNFAPTFGTAGFVTCAL